MLFTSKVQLYLWPTKTAKANHSLLNSKIMNRTEICIITKKEVFTNDFCRCTPSALIVKIMAYGLFFGFENMAKVVKNTFCKDEADQISSAINLVCEHIK